MAGLREFNVLHVSGLCLALHGCCWALPLLDVKGMVLWKMNADVGGTWMSLILLLDLNKDKGLGELVGGRKPAAKTSMMYSYTYREIL